MTSQQVAEKSEKSLGEMLIVIVLVALLMVSFIFYFFKHQGQLTSAGFESMSHIFSARVNGIHAQWFMDAQPKFVAIESSIKDKNDKKIMVPTNKAGWVDVEESALRCQHIWQYVMESPLTYMKQPIGAVLVESNGNRWHSYCQYSLPSGAYFTYQSDTGKVRYQQNIE